MNRLFVPVLISARLVCGQAHAGLAEATDFGGTWTSGSVPYSGTESSPDYWTDQAITTLDGEDAAAGRLDERSVIGSWIETTVTGPTTLYFSYRAVGVASVYSGGGFYASVNGIGDGLLWFPFGFATTADWQEKSLVIPAGDARVVWSFSYPAGADGLVYVDQVWTSDDPRPRLTETSSRAARFNESFSWHVPLHSATPATLTATGLPPGLSLDPDTNLISGAPTAAGSFTATLTVRNTSGQHIARVVFEIAPGATTVSDGLDSTTLTFTQAGDPTAWTGVTGFGHDGIDSARGVASDQPGNVISTILTGPGTLTFWYRGERHGPPTSPPNAPLFIRPTIFLYVGTPPPADGNPFGSTPFQSTGGPDWFQGTAHIQPAAVPQMIYLRGYASAPPSGQHLTYLDDVRFVPSTIPPQPTFSAWQTAWNVAGQPLTADTDGDGFTLPMEYAFGGSPYEANPELMPSVSIDEDYFTIRVTKARSPTDLMYFVQGSRDLVPNSWTTSSVEILDEDSTHLLARSKKPLSEQPVFYLRVRILVAP